MSNVYRNLRTVALTTDNLNALFENHAGVPIQPMCAIANPSIFQWIICFQIPPHTNASNHQFKDMTNFSGFFQK